MERSEADSGITLADLLTAFSLATDLGLGQPMEHVLRSWQIAAQLGTRMALSDEERESLFFVAMLAWVGCIADSPEVAASFGDDVMFRADSFGTDLKGTAAAGFFLRHAVHHGTVAHRLRTGAALVLTGGDRVTQGIRSHCATTSALAERLGLGEDVGAALRQFFTRWDGRGVPSGVRGNDIAPAVRIFHLADVVEVHHRAGGLDAAVAVAQARRGTQFAPDVVDAFCAIAPDILGTVEDRSDVHDLVASEAHLKVRLSGADVDAALSALADFTDLRSAYRAGHSHGVAELAAEAARTMGLPAADVVAVRRAGWVHDVGLHGVPVTILDKAGSLSTTEWERVRLSSYYTERVLARPEALAQVGAVAALAHERMDGSGYHRGLTGSAISRSGRIVAAACAYRAMLEPRAHRHAMAVKQAATALRAEVRAGKFDVESVDAVLTAAGNRPKRRSGPAGLTPREVEVLTLIARGATTADVARTLGISRKTAGTHIERIYMKSGASSRATATLFALRVGLLDPLDL
jgi:HD-GYP domain-containing protein (c-di-GMP phosphodiesterase class II)